MQLSARFGSVTAPILTGSALEAKAMQFTAVFVETSEGFDAFVEELPNAVTRGATLDEARIRLSSLVSDLIQTNRDLAEGTLTLSNLPFRKEPLVLAKA